MIINYNSITITYMQHDKKENIKILAKRIKKLRLEQSNSLNKFCFTKGNVTSATWSRIENALVDPKFSTLIEVSRMLGITLEELFKNLKLNYIENAN